jgi:hypothetical protein
MLGFTLSIRFADSIIGYFKLPQCATSLKYKLTFILVLLASTLVLTSNAYADQIRLKIENIQSSYLSFRTIEPILVNESISPIYLYRFTPLARLARFNEETKEWELGKYPTGLCASTPKSEIPIKIEPMNEMRTGILLWASVDNSDIQWYSLTPWTVSVQPDKIYSVESPEFSIAN